MSTSEIVMLIGGILGLILGGIDFVRSGMSSLTALGVAILGVVFILLAVI